MLLNFIIFIKEAYNKYIHVGIIDLYTGMQINWFSTMYISWCRNMHYQ